MPTTADEMVVTAPSGWRNAVRWSLIALGIALAVATALNQRTLAIGLSYKALILQGVDGAEASARALYAGRVALLTAGAIPVGLGLMISRWKPRTRASYACRFGVWSGLIWVPFIAGPIAVSVANVRTALPSVSSLAPSILVLAIVSWCVFVGVGYALGLGIGSVRVRPSMVDGSDGAVLAQRVLTPNMKHDSTRRGWLKTGGPVLVVVAVWIIGVKYLGDPSRVSSASGHKSPSGSGGVTPRPVVPATTPNQRSDAVLLPLLDGGSLALPKNWDALTNNQRSSLYAAVADRLSVAGIARQESTLPFAANFYDDTGNVAAMFNVRFYPEMEWTQDFVRGLSIDEVADLDSQSRREAEASMRGYGGRLLAWEGTKRSSINGVTALVVEYTRVGARAGTSFCVRLVRVLNGGKSFTVTVSYRKDAERLLRPVCDRIIESIR